MANDIANIEDLNLDKLDDTALMALTGQGNQPATNSGNGLPRLSINYETENDEGVALPRGSWRVMVDGRFVYATKLTLRPFSVCTHIACGTKTKVSSSASQSRLPAGSFP